MNKRKILITAFALLTLFLIGGTMAYFTDTETVTNTFTLGNVDITLTEPNFVAANATGLMPGSVVAKNPIITNVGASSAYVFLKVTEPCYNTAKVFNYTLNSGWTVVGTAGSCSGSGVSTIDTVYAYSNGTAMTELPTSGTTATAALFDNVTINGNLDATAVNALSATTIQMVINAYAIQKDNLSSTAPGTVWTNFSS